MWFLVGCGHPVASVCCSCAGGVRVLVLIFRTHRELDRYFLPASTLRLFGPLIPPSRTPGYLRSCMSTSHLKDPNVARGSVLALAMTVHM